MRWSAPLYPLRQIAGGKPLPPAFLPRPVSVPTPYCDIAPRIQSRAFEMEIVNQCILSQGGVQRPVPEGSDAPYCGQRVETEYDFIFSQVKAGDDKLCLQRSSRKQERPQLAHLLALLRGVKRSATGPGVVRVSRILQPGGSATCRRFRNDSSCGKLSSKISCCPARYQMKCPMPSEGNLLRHSSWSGRLVWNGIHFGILVVPASQNPAQRRRPGRWYRSRGPD